MESLPDMVQFISDIMAKIPLLGNYNIHIRAILVISVHYLLGSIALMDFAQMVFVKPIHEAADILDT